MKIQGKEKFLKQIGALPAAVKAEVRAALEKGARETTDIQRRLAPVDSGALRNSIGFTFGNFRPDNANVRGVSTGRSSAARDAKGEAGLLVTLHAGDREAWYARLVEFGTRGGIIIPRRKQVLAGGGKIYGKKVTRRSQSAQPFFFPGYRLGKKKVMNRLNRAIRNGARKAFK